MGHTKLSWKIGTSATQYTVYFRYYHNKPNISFSLALTDNFTL